MNHRDDYKSGPNLAAGAPSSSTVRGPQGQGNPAIDSGEQHVKTPRPRQPPPSGHASLELPETYGVDEVEILCKDPWWYFAYWEVTDSGLSAARDQLGLSAKEAQLILRVFATGGQSAHGSPGNGQNGHSQAAQNSSHNGSSHANGHANGHASGRSRDGRDIRDVPVQAQHGRRYLEAPRPNSLLRVAIGLLSPEGFFAPIAHSSLLRVPPQQPSAETNVEWLHVQPARSDGRQHERIVKAEAPPDHQERALPWQSGSSSGDGSILHIPGPTDAGTATSSSPPGGAAADPRSPGNGSGRSGG